MLEVQEILELEKRWKSYNQGREVKKNRSKKYLIYALCLFLFIGLAWINLDKISNLATKVSALISKDDPKQNLQASAQNKEQNLQQEENVDEIYSRYQKLIKEQEYENQLNQAYATYEQPQNDEILYKAPKEEIINFEPEVKPSPKAIKIETSGNEISIEKLQEKFKNTNSPSIAVLIAKKYYAKKDYANSEKWALTANELNSENKESWILFAKSKYKLGHKEDAIKVLKIYDEREVSKETQELLIQMQNGAEIK